jgi:hypothetical protein
MEGQIREISDKNFVVGMKNEKPISKTMPF